MESIPSTELVDSSSPIGIDLIPREIPSIADIVIEPSQTEEVVKEEAHKETHQELYEEIDDSIDEVIDEGSYQDAPISLVSDQEINISSDEENEHSSNSSKKLRFTSVKVTLKQDIGSFEKGTKLFATLTDGYFKCPHKNCDAAFRSGKEWHRHVSLVVDHQITSKSTYIFTKDSGQFKIGDVVESDTVDGKYPCVHDDCDRLLLTRSSWITHIRSAHGDEPEVKETRQPISKSLSTSSPESEVSRPFRRLGRPRSIKKVERPSPEPSKAVLKFSSNNGKFKSGDKAISEFTNGSYPCPHDGCLKLLHNKAAWIAHVKAIHFVKPLLQGKHSPKISLTIATANGRLKPGQVVYSEVTENGFPCAHRGCPKMLQSRVEWVAHVRVIHSLGGVEVGTNGVNRGRKRLREEGKVVGNGRSNNDYNYEEEEEEEDVEMKDSIEDDSNPDSNSEEESEEESDTDNEEESDNENEDESIDSDLDTVSVTLMRCVGLYKRGQRLKATAAKGYFYCTHDDCRFKTTIKKDWRNHVGKIAEHRSDKVISTKLRNTTGRFKKGEKVEIAFVDNGYPCIHYGCNKVFDERATWEPHVNSRHKIRSSNIEIEKIKPLKISIKPKSRSTKESTKSTSSPISPIKRKRGGISYLQNDYLKSIINPLDKHIYSQIIHSVQKTLSTKYEEIINFYFQSRYNNLFDRDSMTKVKQVLSKPEINDITGIFGPLPDVEILLDYKKTFISFIITILKISKLFEVPESLSKLFEEFEELAFNMTWISYIEISEQQHAFSHTKDITLQSRMDLGYGPLAQKPKAIVDNDVSTNRRQQNYYRKVAGESVPWPGAFRFDGLHHTLECLHNLLLNMIVDEESSRIVLTALTVLLVDDYENIQWKSPIDAKNIINGILYGLKLILFTQAEIDHIRGPWSIEKNDILQFIEYFLDEQTGTFVLPFYSISKSINDEIGI